MGGSLSPLALANKAESVVSVTSQCSFSSTIVHVGDKKPPESGMGSRVWARLRARARRQVPSQSPLPPSGPPRGEEAASVSDRGAASCFSPARRPMPLCPPSCFLCPLLSPSRGCYPHGPKDTACWKPRKGVGALTQKMSAGRAALQGGGPPRLVPLDGTEDLPSLGRLCTGRRPQSQSSAGRRPGLAVGLRGGRVTPGVVLTFRLLFLRHRHDGGPAWPAARPGPQPHGRP